MSKGLEALDVLKLRLSSQESNKILCGIIEKELKDFECLDNFFQKIKIKYGIDDLDYLGHICSQYKALKKKEKALEIIKKKKVNCSHLVSYTLEDYNSTWSFKGGEKYQLTQEEYDLLKEVLL